MDATGPVTLDSTWHGPARAILLAMAVCALVLLAVEPAGALTLTAPATTFDTVKCVVTVEPADPAGTVTLLRDGQPWAQLSGTPGDSLVFPNVAFKGTGTHTLSAVISTGTSTVTSPGLTVTVYASPRPPSLVGMDGSKLTGRKARIKVQVAANVTLVELYVNGRFVRRFHVTPNKVNDLGSFAMPLTSNTIGVKPGNSAGYGPATTWRFGRFSYPAGWPTCIVVVKSKLRLYWIRNDVLVKSYPVATGRPSMPTPSGTWRVGIKYYTSPSSSSGPRKMRLFRLRGGRYVYTAYGIHGTNVQSSVGTYASHGCIRLHSPDIIELFSQVPMHTLVQTR